MFTETFSCITLLISLNRYSFPVCGSRLAQRVGKTHQKSSRNIAVEVLLYLRQEVSSWFCILYVLAFSISCSHFLLFLQRQNDVSQNAWSFSLKFLAGKYLYQLLSQDRRIAYRGQRDPFGLKVTRSFLVMFFVAY
jgi:hypothetical protein